MRLLRLLQSRIPRNDKMTTLNDKILKMNFFAILKRGGNLFPIIFAQMSLLSLGPKIID